MVEFGTGGWRAVIGDGFTKKNIQKVGAAVGARMQAENTLQFVIGYDRRFLSREAAIWFTEALVPFGVQVLFINLSAPTPQVMFTVKNLNLQYGAAITASHNPAVYNGIKLFTYGGRDAVPEITNEIAAAANALSDVKTIPFDKALKEGKVVFIDPRDEYLDSIISQIDMNAIKKRRPRIVLDPMYGVSLTGLQTLLYTARCDVDVIHDRHDAFFGGHLPTPEPATLTELQMAVKEHNAALGIATDGDADRLGIIDEKGDYITANQVLVLLYFYLLKYKGWRGDAIRNISTTHQLDRVAEAFGQKCHEVPVGFKWVSSGMDKYDAIIGGESSGGLTVKGHIHGKDGLYAASLLVEMLSVTGKPLSQLVRELEDTYGSYFMAEYDWALTPEFKEEIRTRIFTEKVLPEYSKEIDHVSYADGCKIYFKDDSWIIVRFSGTEPRVRIFAESSSIAAADELVKTMTDFIGLNFASKYTK